MDNKAQNDDSNSSSTPSTSNSHREENELEKIK